jgi:hypothetical protein
MTKRIVWRVALHVAPPALGALELKLELNGDKLDLRIAAARAPVRALLDAGLSGPAERRWPAAALPW